MNEIKIIIEVRGGVVQEVYGNISVRYVIVDYDNLSHGQSPVSSPNTCITVGSQLHLHYTTNDPDQLEIREELKSMKF